MVRSDFDNIMKVIQVGNTLAGGNIVSIEIDLELPRGFVAKIFQVYLMWINMHEDLDGLGAIFDTDLAVEMALLRDPDDITTTVFPDNRVQHDVIAMANFNLFFDTDATQITAIWSTEMKKLIEFPKHIDVITARNMRFNLVGLGSDIALLTESAGRAEVYYTLEEVKDKDILDLLDIL